MSKDWERTQRRNGQKKSKGLASEITAWKRQCRSAEVGVDNRESDDFEKEEIVQKLPLGSDGLETR